MSATAALLLQTLGELQSHAVCTTGLPTITEHWVDSSPRSAQYTYSRRSCGMCRGSQWFQETCRQCTFFFKASLHNPVDRGIQKLWPSSNSGRLTVPSFPHILHHANLWLSSLSCFLLAWFVWLTCSMSGFPDVGYTTVAHYTLSGELYTFPSCPRGFLQEKLRLRQSLVLFYAAIGIYHWILFRHALHTKKNFSPVHFGCVLLAENRHYTYEYQGVTMGQRAMIGFATWWPSLYVCLYRTSTFRSLHRSQRK